MGTVLFLTVPIVSHYFNYADRIDHPRGKGA